MSEVLGKYRLIAELGRGGMGTVYLAVIRGPARFNKLVVIKQLRTDVSDDPNFTTMFLEEARLAARLNHPNIVQTNEVVCDPHDGYFIVMEYLEGASLKSLLRRLRAHADSPERSPRIRGLFIRAILEVLSALQYAHDLKDFDGEPLHIVHRDVSPANVVVAHGGQVKLLDFGIAKAADSVVRTQTGILKGKIHFMAPEPLAGDPVDNRADIFSVGAMLWDALAGRRLWEGMKDFEIVNSLLKGFVPSPRTVNPDVPENLEAICMRALACKAADRYPTAAAFREDLEKACAGSLASTDDLSAAMAAEFWEDQQQMRTRIAEQLQMADDIPTSVLPKFTTRMASSMPQGRASESSLSRAQAPPPVERPAAPPPPGRRAAIPPLAWKALAAAGGLAVLVAFLALRASTPKPVATPAADPAASSVAEVAPPAATETAEPAKTGTTDMAAPATTGEIVDSEHGAHAAAHGHHAIASGHVAGLHGGKHGGGATGSDLAMPAETPAPEHAAVETTPAPAPPPPPAQTAAEAPASPATPPAQDTAAAAPALPPGTIPKSAQNSVFSAHRGEVQACWDRAQMEQPYLHVRLSVVATVAPDGHVSDANVTSNKDGTARFQACLRSAVLTWVYPKPAGDVPGKVTIPLVFEE